MKKKPSKLKRIVRDPNGPFRMRVVSDKKKYTRKTKHKNKEDAYLNRYATVTTKTG